MVALEVIEHLSQETLERFAPMVLGEYRPRLLLISTPSEFFGYFAFRRVSTVLTPLLPAGHRLRLQPEI